MCLLFPSRGWTPSTLARAQRAREGEVTPRSVHCTNLQKGEPTSAEVEVVLEADGEAGMGNDPADAGKDAGDERRPVERVVPDGERLSRRAEQHLLVRHQAPDALAVHADPVDVSAAGTVEGAGRG